MPLALSRHAAAYMPHDPIEILSDNDFTSENGIAYGSGTVSDPYVIARWNITGGDFGIKVANTHKHFAIRNNWVANSTFDGIAVSFVADGTCEVSRNTVRFAGNDGIIIIGTNRALIFGNDAQFSFSSGIVLRDSDSNIVFKNIANHNNYRPFGATAGIYIDASCFNLVIANRAEDNSPDFAPGIWLIRWSNSNVVTKNIVRGNLVGIQVDWRSTGNILRNNKAFCNENGISILASSNGNIVRKNFVVFNSFSGIFVHNSSGSFISQNRIFRNNVGIRIEWADRNIICRNKVRRNVENGIAVTLWSSFNSIKRNIVRLNGGFDLYWDSTGIGNIWKSNNYKTRNWH